MDLIQLNGDVVSSVVYYMHTKVPCRSLSKFQLQWFPTRGGSVDLRGCSFSRTNVPFYWSNKGNPWKRRLVLCAPSGLLVFFLN